MVQNLNILSFASYGNLLTERPGGVGLPKGPHWEERLLTATAQETYQYLSSDSVYLDYESGMSILAVAKEGEEFQYFYLDKPVCVYPGVRFAIAPYQDSCTVHMMAPPPQLASGGAFDGVGAGAGAVPAAPGGAGVHLLLPRKGTGLLLPGGGALHAGVDLCG